MRQIKIKHLFLGAFIAASTCISAQARDQLPLEAFAALPDFDDAELSTKATKIAFAFSREGRKHIVFQDLDGSNASIIRPPSKWEINSFFWANDTILILKVGGLQARPGIYDHKTYNTRMFSYDTEKDKYIRLGKPERYVKGQNRNNRRDTDIQFNSQLERVLDTVPNDSKYILLELDFDLDAYTTVYRVNVKTGRRKVVQKEIDGILNWHTDQSSEVRIGFGLKGVKYDKRYAIYKNAAGKWESLKNLEWRKKYSFRSFTDDPTILYVSGSSTYGTNGLYKLNILTGKIIAQVFEHETVDMGYVAHDPATGKAVGIGYRDDFSRVSYFDRDFRIVQKTMDRSLKGSVNRIVGRVPDQQLFLVYSYDDRNPGDYYLYDRAAKKLEFIAPSMSSIDLEKTATTERVDVPVRDGSNIPVYVTRPAGKDKSNLPTIILPHGGPGARDGAGWDFWAQFYADRGYLVLKPNFRGSTGYGNSFRYKGVRQWGGLMQDDVTDTTKWAISEGMADPKRICIVGASYGGYAALMGVIKEQGLYKCAISVNGVTNLPALKTHDKSTIGGNVWGKTMGLVGQEDETVSPFHNAEKIQVPVLLMSSTDDQRIPYAMSVAMNKRLKKLNKARAFPFYSGA